MHHVCLQLWFGQQLTPYNIIFVENPTLILLFNMANRLSLRKRSCLCTPDRRLWRFKFSSGFLCPFFPWPSRYMPGQLVHCQIVKRGVGIAAADHWVSDVARISLQDQTGQKRKPTWPFTAWFISCFLLFFFEGSF